MTKDQALKLALEALENYPSIGFSISGIDAWDKCKKAINAIKEALAQPDRQWVGLTPEEVMAIGRKLGLKCKMGGNPNIDFDYAQAIEAKLKEKNT